MVAFNPEVPSTPPPNFTGYAWTGHTITAPEADTSGAIRGKALGNLIEGLSTTADTYMKQNIDAKIHEGTDQNDQAMISNLNALKADLGVGTDAEKKQAEDLGLSGQSVREAQPANAGTTSSPAADSPKLISPTVDGQAPPPPAVDNGIAQASKIQMAQAANGGKISDLYYRGQMMGLQQSLRNQYPAYRDYIDNKMGNTANAYRQELLEQLNQALTAKNKGAEHLHNGVVSEALKAMNSGDPSARMYLNLLQRGPNGEYDAAIMDSIQRSNQATWEFSRAVKEAEGGKALNELETQRFQQPTIKFIQDTFKNKWDDLWTNAGAMPDDKMRQLMQEAITDPKKNEAVLQQAQLRQQALAHVREYTLSELNKPYRNQAGQQLFPDGRGPTKTYSQDQLKQWIDEASAPYTAINRMVSEKDIPMANYMQDLNKAQKEGNMYTIMHDPVWSNIAAKGQIMHDIGTPPDIQAEFYRKAVWGPQGKGVMDYFMGMHLMDQMTGQKKADGSPVTPSDWADKAFTNNTATPRNMSMVLNQLPQMSESNFDPRVRNNYYHSWFDPKNNILDEKYLNKDFKDQAGNWVPGKVYAFNKILNPTTLADIKKLDQTNPGLWEQAGTWAVSNFRDKIYSNEIGTLKDIDSTPWLKVTYNSDTHQFGIADFEGKPFVQPLNRQYRPVLQQSLARLNGGIKALNNFATLDGNFDMNSFILKTLATTGEGVSQKLFNAVKTGGVKIDTKPETRSDADELIGSPGSKLAMNILPGDSLKLENVADKGVSTANIHPAFRAGLEKALADYKQETGAAPHISSLFRTNDQQVEAYKRFLGGGGLAAPPGYSLHQYGMAADLNSDAKFAEWLRPKSDQYGLEFLGGHAGRVDPYHIQLSKKYR